MAHVTLDNGGSVNTDAIVRVKPIDDTYSRITYVTGDKEDFYGDDLRAIRKAMTSRFEPITQGWMTRDVPEPAKTETAPKRTRKTATPK